MTEPNPTPTATGSQLPWRWQLAFAIALVLVFLVLVWVLVAAAGDPPAKWQNLVYVFGSVEALVFTAVGWVFGREVQRAQVQHLKASEKQAKDQAQASAGKAEKATAEAAQQRGRVSELAAGIRLADAVEAVSSGASGGARDVGLGGGRGYADSGGGAAPGAAAAAPRSAALAELRRLADRLSPEG